MAGELLPLGAQLRQRCRRDDHPAVPDGDQWILSGRKAWITSAGVSRLYTVFAKTDPAAGHRGISAFAVEHDRPGLSVGKLEHKIGLRGSPTGSSCSRTDRSIREPHR
jgi:alkylation response protein AidB-like acyl-CoA dehydrogenase